MGTARLGTLNIFPCQRHFFFGREVKSLSFWLNSLSRHGGWIGLLERTIPQPASGVDIVGRYEHTFRRVELTSAHR